MLLVIYRVGGRKSLWRIRISSAKMVWIVQGVNRVMRVKMGMLKKRERLLDYPMDYYAQDVWEWNSCYFKKQSHPIRRDLAPCNGSATCS